MLEKRTTEPEIMEQSECDPSLLREGYRLMARFNRTMGGIRVVRRFIEARTAKRTASRPLRVLDLGSGGCDIPLAISRWAVRRGLAIHLTCLDLSPVAIQVCRENIQRAGRAGANTHPIRADIFSYIPPEPFDCAVGSMFFHHFTDDQILQLAGRLRSFVTGSLLVSDLLRYTPVYAVASLVTLPLPREIRHDVLVSFRRGFKLTELRHLFHQLPGVRVEARRDRFFRAVAEVEFCII